MSGYSYVFHKRLLPNGSGIAGPAFVSRPREGFIRLDRQAEFPLPAF